MSDGTRALLAIEKARCAMLEAGVAPEVFEVDQNSYLLALWDARHEVRLPRPGTKAVALYERSFESWASLPRATESVSPFRQAYVMPGEEIEFNWCGVTIRNAARARNERAVKQP